MRAPCTASLLAATAITLLPAGCRDSTDDSPGAPAAAAPAEPAYDLPAIMEGIARTLRDEREVLSKADRAWDTLTDADRAALWAALEERMRLGDECMSMLRAYPHWTESCCEWLVTVVLEDLMEVTTLRLRLGGRDPASGRTNRSGENRFAVLLFDAAGSKEAARAYLRHSTGNPGSPSGMLELCQRTGHIDVVDGEFELRSSGPVSGAD